MYVACRLGSARSIAFQVIYVVCPFPEPAAILQTVIESSVAIGSTIFLSDKERRCIMHNHVGKELSCSAAVDEASTSTVRTSIHSCRTWFSGAWCLIYSFG